MKNTIVSETRIRTGEEIVGKIITLPDGITSLYVKRIQSSSYDYVKSEYISRELTLEVEIRTDADGKRLYVKDCCDFYDEDGTVMDLYLDLLKLTKVDIPWLESLGFYLKGIV